MQTIARGDAALSTPRLPEPDTPSLLAIDPDLDARARLVRCCNAARIDIRTCETIDEALSDGLPPDVIFLDIAAVDSPADLVAAVQRLRERRRVPVAIAITAADDHQDVRVAAARAGAELFLAKPVSKQPLADAVRALRQRAQPSKRRILILDDDEDFVSNMQALLDRAGYAAVGLTDSATLLDSLRAIRPDAVLVDLRMPHYGGIELTSMLRNSREFDDTPVIFLSGHDDPESIRAAFAAGADDFLVKPVGFDDLRLRIDARIERTLQLRSAAGRDPLTRLLTRGPFQAALQNRIASAVRNGTRLTFCLIDLDHFKTVNDSHGHQIGDEVLAALGHLIRSEFRAEDLRCRWGGEEIALAFPESHDRRTIQSLIEGLLARFRAMPFRGADGQTFTVTFSAGLSEIGPGLSDMDGLIHVADRRLYRAKARGRACVVADDDDVTRR